MTEKMNTNKTIKFLSILVFVLIIVLAFVVLDVNKTGNASKILNNKNLGNNVTVEQTKEGTLTTVYWTLDNEDGTISSKKLSTYAPNSAPSNITCELSCTNTGVTGCSMEGCDAFFGGCSKFNCGPSCTGSCKGTKTSTVSSANPNIN